MLTQNQERLEDFLKWLSECLLIQNVAPKDFWEVDEKGFQMGKGVGANKLGICRVRVKSPGK